MPKPSVPWVRRAQRVIRMVEVLHQRGFQCLRLMPYAYPLAYRVAVAPRLSFSAINSACIEGGTDLVATHSCAGDGARFFEWADATTDSATVLADKFLERFPRVAAHGKGRDWAYAGWLQ